MKGCVLRESLKVTVFGTWHGLYQTFKWYSSTYIFCTDRYLCLIWTSLTKQSTSGDATTGFPTKWRLKNERRNSILMTRHFPDLGSTSDWLNQIPHAARPIRSATQIWVVTRHQHGISVLVSQTSFGGETSGSGRDPFKQNFRKFRSKTQWIGSVQPEKFRKNWSTFWRGPLFPVGPVRILVEWIAPSVGKCRLFSQAKFEQAKNLAQITLKQVRGLYWFWFWFFSF